MNIIVVMVGEMSRTTYKTFSFRVKDATSGKELVRLGDDVNTVWNYCNEVSAKSALRDRRWASRRQLEDLTKGSSREMNISAQMIQKVVKEFVDKRTAAGRPRLRWRASRGARRSLGWIPFTNQEIFLEGSVARLGRRKFRLWRHREIEGRIKSGNFSQDARGRWYCNLVCEIERPVVPTNRNKVVGVDFGLKTAATASDGRMIEQSRFYRDLEGKLAEAQRQGRKRLLKTIHAKIANRRKDALHKYSRAVVDDAGAVFVGNVSSTWQTAVGNGKAVLDVSWSALRDMLRYKCDHAGVMFMEVNESYTTQTCSCCGSKGGPKGREGLDIRRWECSDCGTVHDRDGNAAINIARLGCEALGLQ